MKWAARPPVTEKSKAGGQKKRTGGFTIVETMIVLAVTGAIFVSAIAMIQGKQPQAQFRQSVNGIVTTIQQYIHDVSIGYYPDLDITQNCTEVETGTASHLEFGAGTAKQGQNKGCVFLGKILQFGLPVNSSGDQQYAVYTLAGCQHMDCDDGQYADEATTLGEARPEVLYSAHPSPGSAPDDTIVTNLQNGLTLESNSMKDANGTVVTAFGLLQSFGTYSPPASAAGGCDGGLCSGSQQIGLYAITGSGACSSPHTSLATAQQCLANAVSTIDYDGLTPKAANLVETPSISMCLVSGTTNESGTVTITEDGNVTLKMHEDKTC